jgi:hypothetical protein
MLRGCTRVDLCCVNVYYSGAESGNSPYPAYGVSSASVTRVSVTLSGVRMVNGLSVSLKVIQ